MNVRLTSLLILALFFAACKHKTDDLVAPAPVELKKEIILDAVYNGDGQRKMDVFLPEKRGNNTPIVLLLHGGAWTGGSKAEFKSLQENLLERGIASANIDYLLASSQAHLPEMMADIDVAVAYLKKNATLWSVNTDKIAIGGASAGAHLAMMYAFKYDIKGVISCIISGAGPSSVDNRDALDEAVRNTNIWNICAMVGSIYVPGASVEPFKMASPIYSIKNIPLMCIHGDNDVVVPDWHSKQIDNAMAVAGYPHELIILQGTGHDLNLGDPVKATYVYDQIGRWIKAYKK